MAAILILSDAEQAAPLTAHLNGHELTFAKPTQDTAAQIISGVFALVLATPQEGLSVFFEHLSAQTSPHLCPPVLIWSETDSNIHSEYPQAFGYVSTMNAAAQVALALKMREQLLALQNKANAFEREVAELKSAQTELELLKNAIVKNVSHELKTPLMHVKAAVAMMREPNMDQDKLIEYATNATSRLEAIVKNITMLGDSLDINPGPVIVREAIEAARRNLYRTWESRDQTDRIKTQLAPNLPPTFADRQGLITVLQLLIDNALKFSTKDVIVHAHLNNDQSKIIISIQDFGIGIAKDKIDGIFQSFFQVDGSSTRRFGGTGVGLSIVKLILDCHNSHIEVESEVNQGSLFRFALSAVRVEAR